MSTIQIERRWRDRTDKTQQGIERIDIEVSRPYEAPAPPIYRSDNDYQLHGEEGSLSVAQQNTRVTAARLRFIDATGLKPSDSRVRAMPPGERYNRPMGTDHVRTWYDPSCRGYVLTSEPYGWNSTYPYADVGESALREWLVCVGWRREVAEWPGMWNPPMSRLEVLAPVSYPRWDELMRQINAIKEAA